MKKSTQIRATLASTNSVSSIAHILENIASIRITQIKDEVLQSRDFFSRLWSMYGQLRVSDKDARANLATTATIAANAQSNKKAVILITANAGLTGEVDTILINQVLTEVDPKTTDFFVLGMHGQSLLLQHNINPIKTLRFPEVGQAIDVGDLMQALVPYSAPTVYYPSYDSLSIQRVFSLELKSTVQKLGAQDRNLNQEEIIFKDNCIFEPSVVEVVAYLEQMMMSTILTEIILESNLAQLSSRFNAMNVASSKATDMAKNLQRRYVQLRRYESDESNRRYSNSRKATV
jgi:ATP synthase F1 gamma subunit